MYLLHLENSVYVCYYNYYPVCTQYHRIVALIHLLSCDTDGENNDSN